MVGKEIPFRPKLEGVFRKRFYDAVSTITEATDTEQIDELSAKEISWVENECHLSLEQRKRYRATWLLLRDLKHASWRTCYHDGVLLMRLPTLDGAEAKAENMTEYKKLMRGWMADSRLERLDGYSEFIHRMEEPANGRRSIRELIADGNELADRLELAKGGKLAVEEAVKPYLQLIEDDTTTDSFTGLKLSEIWRYFRLTWSTPAETTPGRTMQYLIRDAAHPLHAVMGIASLENCAVQITCRDDFIGWNQGGFVTHILQLKPDEAKKEFELLLSYIETGIAGIDCTGLCTKEELERPTDECIQALVDSAAQSEQERQNHLRRAREEQGEKDTDVAERGIEERSELGSISKSAADALYRRKRAAQLAKLLASKKEIRAFLKSDSFETSIEAFCHSDAGNSAIRGALVAQKTKHIGSSLMELNVCGAIPPYNEILGGKLVALLATSPQIIHDYRLRYQNKPSEIASRLKNEKVYRPADLVYVGTTSLYYVGSSQYNRLRIPRSVFDGDFDVVWKELGRTYGFGTLHISKATTLSLNEAMSADYTHINHVFGEGASPKMRLLSMGIRGLLESRNEDTKDFTKHAMARIVYGAALASNTREYLLGKAERPEYYTDVEDYERGTQKVIDFWSRRWLTSRLAYEPIYERIRQFDKKSLMVSRELSTNERWEFKKLKETMQMPTAASEGKAGLDFIRDFYRGTSAFADNQLSAHLAGVHVRTKLDDEIINVLQSGRDVVLTGNPGDGKTHIIRMLEPELSKLGIDYEIELDASTLSDEELYRHWRSAREMGKRFILAINAAVLYSLKDYCEAVGFTPAIESYRQMIHSVVFHSESESCDNAVVFDLSKREVLTKEILQKAIERMTDDQHYTQCSTCQFRTECSVHVHRQQLRNELLQDRLLQLLQRAAFSGYHATLRELQSFISYLIFGNRSCQSLVKTSERNQYDLATLIYEGGRGKIFDAIRKGFDPTHVSHPTWDERILSNTIERSGWISGYTIPDEALAIENEELFLLRKRQFYFFHENGDVLLRIADDDVTRYRAFLCQADKALIKEAVKLLNCFFGERAQKKDLQVWCGHRYNHDPRRVLISTGRISTKSFTVGRPKLLESMKNGIDMLPNYVRLELEEARGVYLKLDFAMYRMLIEAYRGVPVLYMESDEVKQVWRFMEMLPVETDDEEYTVDLLDVQSRARLTVSIEQEKEQEDVVYKYDTIKVEG